MLEKLRAKIDPQSGMAPEFSNQASRGSCIEHVGYSAISSSLGVRALILLPLRSHNDGLNPYCDGMGMPLENMNYVIGLSA